MKTLIGTGIAVLSLALSVSLAMANPALLPSHPGYPASGNANDKGQTNATGEKALSAAAAKEPRYTEQHLVDPNNDRIVEKSADGRSDGKFGRLPKVQGPQIKVQPPVESATKITGERTIN
jgi:hypothetical protein